MARPQTGDFGAFYQKYVDYAKGETIAELIQTYSDDLIAFVQALPEAKANYAYDENKWTVKQLLQHIIDTERIFSYRALAIGRGDKTPLPGFEENDYAKNATAHNRSLVELKTEFALVRNATNALLLSFTANDLEQKGIASNNQITCNALCFILFGHIIHHQKILIEKYL